MKDAARYSTVGHHAGSAAVSKLLYTAFALTFLITLSAYAGGSNSGDPRTFAAYRLELNCGPVKVAIQGHSATEVVTVAEKNIPPDVSIEYSKRGGILHVTAVVKESAEQTSTASTSSSSNVTAPAETGEIVATMPRYEFVDIKSSSGDVSIDNLSTNHLTVETGSGAIHITNTNAALKAQSTSGNQSYEQIYGAIKASSTTGNVKISNTWGTMALNSQSGSFVGTKVDLAGSSSFRTDSGSIKMGLTYGLSRYTFDLESSGGTLKLGDIVRNDSIRWGRGNIRVTGVTKSGEQDFQ